MSEDLRIIFFGTPDFAATSLERLIQSKYKPILVVTQPDMPVGRKQILTPPSVKSYVAKHETWNIKVLQPEKLDSSFKFQVSSFKPDLFVVAAYGKIIPKSILDIPKYGTLNVHPSLLPRWRGPSPIQYSILVGDKKTGVTIMLMDEEVDHGDIVSSIEYLVSSTETAEVVSSRLADIGANLLIKTIPKWVAGEIESQEQDHSQATYSKILTKKDGHIDWNKSAKEIERQIRAFTPWPGSFTFWEDRRIKIISGRLSKMPPSASFPPGKIFSINRHQIAVKTGRGVFLIEKLQLAGKGEMTAKQFLNGYPGITTTVLK